MTLSKKNLYTYCDAELGKVLSSHGFGIEEPGMYMRKVDDGIDRVAIAPSKGQKFSVMLSYFPEYMAAIEGLDREEESQGFPVGPYVSPHAVSSRERSWSFKDRAAMERSVREVAAAIEAVGLPWLDKLRDPSFYLSQVTRHAEIVRGFSAERAGEADIAKAAFEEMYRRYKLNFEELGNRLPPHMVRGLILTAEKLDRDPELRKQLAARLEGG
jgi:hypothetical protein